jgi:hypothetical protein
MGLLFRLERFGLAVPQVLAAGERTLPGNQVNAFLLTRIPSATKPLARWLEDNTDLQNRQIVLGQAEQFLARLHQAGCFFRAGLTGLEVQEQDGAPPRLVLVDVAGLTVRRRLRWLWRWRDLRRWRAFAGGGA